MINFWMYPWHHLVEEGNTFKKQIKIIFKNQTETPAFLSMNMEMDLYKILD